MTAADVLHRRFLSARIVDVGGRWSLGQLQPRDLVGREPAGGDSSPARVSGIFTVHAGDLVG